MDVRPQGPEIIRTWLFDTVVRSHFEHGCLPWHTATINGWILDPDRKKMSKSKGNVVTPLAVLEQYGADAVRYWAASGRPGTDTALDESQMKIGRRLAIKLLNATRFALNLSPDSLCTDDADPAAVTEPLDRALVASLAALVAQATEAFDAYDYARALERTEAFFWSFCDDYLELVKSRAYGGDTFSEAETASARATLDIALSVLLRLFAPFLPFAAEEVWSWWRVGSVHRAPWPRVDELGDVTAGDPATLAATAAVLGAIRRAKSDAKASMRTAVELVIVRDTPEHLAHLELAARDLREAGNVAELRTEALGDGGEPAVTVTLASP
jgi:valyl-tRNA synthetase